MKTNILSYSKQTRSSADYSSNEHNFLLEHLVSMVGIVLGDSEYITLVLIDICLVGVRLCIEMIPSVQPNMLVIARSLSLPLFFICLLVYLFVCLFIYLFVCLFVCGGK
jgi:hypothetical protein